MVTVENFPDNPPDKQHCLVWVRKVDGEKIRFHCSSKDDCEKVLPQYVERAAVADQKGWKDL